MATQVNVQPGHGKGGRQPTRQFLDSLSGHDDPGMFGRMFPNLEPLAVDDGPLKELADAMRDANPGDAAGNNAKVPAGFTYLGQFVDHDITLDLTSLGDKEADPAAIENFRTPALDLDSVYGLGPDGSRQLYARNPGDADGKTPGPKLLTGKTISVDDVVITPRNDLPRNPEGFALIGDHRNDENLVVAQTHLAMLKFHNKVCDHLAASGVPAGELFAQARQMVTWHYQWLVLHDFVERITEKGIVAKILDQGRRFYRFKKTPYMPVEFSAAAYRFGHSMVREVYSHNRKFTPGGGIPATLNLLFKFTGLSGGIIGDLAPDPVQPPLPIPVLSSNWIIDWRRYYEVLAANPPDVRLNPSRKVDPFLIPQLHDLPGGGGSLPFRNLKRGVMLGLPSGQDVARAMKIKNPLTSGRDREGDGRRRGKEARPARAYPALVLHPQGGGAARRRRKARTGRGYDRGGSVRRPRAWRPSVVSVAEEGLEADAAVQDSWRFHHGRPAEVRR